MQLLNECKSWNCSLDVMAINHTGTLQNKGKDVLENKFCLINIVENLLMKRN